MDRLPKNIILKGDEDIWYKDLSEYVPLSYNENYCTIDEKLKETFLSLDYEFEDVRLKIKIEYPNNIQVGNQCKIVVELITKDAKVATTPDLDNNTYEKVSDNEIMTPINEYNTYSSLFNINKVNSAILEENSKS